MPSVPILPTRQERLGIKETIRKSGVSGVRKHALEAKHLWGIESVPSDRDYMEALLWIKGKDTQQPIQWVFNRPQTIQDYLERRREIAGIPIRDATLKARQFGISKYNLGKAFAKCSRIPHFPAAIVADLTKSAARMLEDGKLMYALMPEEARLPLKKSNSSEIKWADPHNSLLEINSAEGGQPLRSSTFRKVHCTESAFWTNPEAAMRAINNAVPRRPGTALSHESTANGMGTWWHRFWWNARRDPNNSYYAYFFPWFFDPDFDYWTDLVHGDHEMIMDTLDDEEIALIALGVKYEQLKWRRGYIAEEMSGDLDAVHQEMPSTPEEAFLGSGRPVFDQGMCIRAIARCAKPIWRGEIVIEGMNEAGTKLDFRLQGKTNGRMQIWAEPEQGKVYTLVSDACNGITGGDPAYCSINEMGSGEQVACWHGNVIPPMFGQICACMGWHFDGGVPAYAVPERNGPGGAAFEMMRQVGYYNLGRRPVFGAVKRKQEAQFGWETNVKTKEIAINAMREHLAIGAEGYQFNDPKVYQEAIMLQVQDDGSYEPPASEHDDRIITACIMCVILKDALSMGLETHLPPPPPGDWFSQHLEKQKIEDEGGDPHDEDWWSEDQDDW